MTNEETGAKVSIEQSTAEVNGWLDFKKIGVTKREAQKDSIASLIEAVSEGSIVFKEDKTIIQTLKFPIEGEFTTKTIDFKPRININTVHKNLQGVSASNADARILAYVAALTDKPKGYFAKIDTEDYSIMQSIVIFFL